ncbi:hypothetical protein [Nocardia jejuensis]|uniref:hypothetical protein n=1 Tax=Nocardia jejuensis TaxID=328049 RepID=UPI00082C439A|nr:hypothetical protein [Nocardia jejuensis]
MSDMVQGVADNREPRHYRPIYVAEGRVVDPGALVKLPDGRYVEPQLVRCANGHNVLAPGAALIGWLSCPVPGMRGGHRLTRCRCGAVDYRPPLDPDCPCQRDPYRAPEFTQ